jgi:heme-degrading monooxygenase HmoA
VILLLYTVTLRDESRRAEHEEMKRQMRVLAESIPGFLGEEDYRNEADGSMLGVLRFEDETALAAWRDHPSHGAVHNVGVESVYASYRVEVFERKRDASFTWTPDATASAG